MIVNNISNKYHGLSIVSVTNFPKTVNQRKLFRSLKSCTPYHQHQSILIHSELNSQQSTNWLVRKDRISPLQLHPLQSNSPFHVLQETLRSPLCLEQRSFFAKSREASRGQLMRSPLAMLWLTTEQSRAVPESTAKSAKWPRLGPATIVIRETKSEAGRLDWNTLVCSSAHGM